jgi:thiamine pyrophosphate-dependent acetolactate synthase large subunit-like protein
LSLVQRIASELLLERLADWDVDTVFGLPGDGINGTKEGSRRAAMASGAVAGVLAALEFGEAGDG